jgi:hypothetical protein
VAWVSTRGFSWLGLLLMALAGAPAGCTTCAGEAGSPETSARGSSISARAKIRFDLDRLDHRGLQGQPDGLRALQYEYCITDRPGTIREVRAIDPTHQIQRGSPGRVGCGEGELLCLGHTRQADYRLVLERLAALPWIAEIREAFFE